MAEYITKEEAVQELYKVSHRLSDPPIDTTENEIIKELHSLMHKIEQIPSADVVEIVRCMYCKRSEKRNGNRYCTYWQDTVDPMHYCGKGDRREPLQK